MGFSAGGSFTNRTEGGISGRYGSVTTPTVVDAGSGSEEIQLAFLVAIPLIECWQGEFFSQVGSEKLQCEILLLTRRHQRESRVTLDALRNNVFHPSFQLRFRKVRIPSDGDQHSELMSIMIPK
jgi:hypothetical protein